MVLDSHPQLSQSALLTLLLLSAISCSSQNGARTEELSDSERGDAGAASFELPEPTTDPMVAPCDLYVVLEHANREDYIVRTNLRTGETSLVAQGRYGIHGAAISEFDDTLYVIAGRHGKTPGAISAVNVHTGELTEVAVVPGTDVHGLAANGDGGLSTWVRAEGLATLSLETKEVASQAMRGPWADGLAWSADGSTFFGVKATQLYRADADSRRLSKVTTLGGKTVALANRPDGLLLGALEKSTAEEPSLELLVIDPEQGTEVQRIEHPLTGLSALRGRAFDGLHVEALAWNPACGVPSAGGLADIISDVSVSETEVCSGHTVTVGVEASHPFSDKVSVSLTVGRVPAEPGDEVQIQIPAASDTTWSIPVTARTAEGFVDIQTVEVAVVDCPDQPPTPVIGAKASHFERGRSEFVVSNADQFGSDSTYSWDFGDGSTFESDAPFAEHSFADGLDATSEFETFDITVTVESGEGTALGRRTLAVWNFYAATRTRGFLRPDASYATSLTPGESAVVRVVNREPEDAIYFTKLLVRHRPCTLDAAAVEVSNREIRFSFDPGETRTLTIEDVGALDSSVCSVELHFIGESDLDLPVYVDAYFDVEGAQRAGTVLVDAELTDLLDSLHASGLIEDRHRVTQEQLHRLHQQGYIDEVPSVFATAMPDTAPAASPLVRKNHGTMPEEGALCAQGSPRHGDLECRPTDELFIAPPFIANANRGDSVLSAGCGLVGEILSKVEPVERYTHVGMVTRDMLEIRNSTASADWLYNQTRDPERDGLRREQLQFLWPGIISQTVGQAYAGLDSDDCTGETCLRAPDGELYALNTFNSAPAKCTTNGVLTLPSVLRPPPDFEPEVRPVLHAVAAEMERLEGHYRFFGYSMGEIANDPAFQAPEELYWPEGVGSNGTVCSSSVWAAMRRLEVPLEGEVTPDELGPIAGNMSTPHPDAPPPGVEDGIYFYTEDERTVAAEHLWTVIRDSVLHAIPATLFRIVKAENRVATQVTNCFASDRCEVVCDPDPDGPQGVCLPQPWEKPGEGTAISPDNMMAWDGPAQGGVYGFLEPLGFRAGVISTRFTWQRVPDGSGDAHGVVQRDGEPQAGARVVVVGTDLTTTTLDDGTFSFTGIGVGRQLLRASWTETLDNTTPVFSGESTVDVLDGEMIEDIVIDLQGPPRDHRDLVIEYDIEIKDDEVRDDVFQTFRETVHRTLTPLSPHATWSFDECVGGEVVVRVDADFSLNVDDLSIGVALVQRGWERRKCRTKDGFFNETADYVVHDRETVVHDAFFRNGEVAGGDHADIHIEFTNNPLPR